MEKGMDKIIMNTKLVFGLSVASIVISVATLILVLVFAVGNSNTAYENESSYNYEIGDINSNLNYLNQKVNELESSVNDFEMKIDGTISMTGFDKLYIENNLISDIERIKKDINELQWKIR